MLHLSVLWSLEPKPDVTVDLAAFCLKKHSAVAEGGDSTTLLRSLARLSTAGDETQVAQLDDISKPQVSQVVSMYRYIYIYIH